MLLYFYRIIIDAPVIVKIIFKIKISFCFISFTGVYIIKCTNSYNEMNLIILISYLIFGLEVRGHQPLNTILNLNFYYK